MKKNKEEKNWEFLNEVAQQKILGGKSFKGSTDADPHLTLGNCKTICVPTSHNIEVCQGED